MDVEPIYIFPLWDGEKKICRIQTDFNHLGDASWKYSDFL